MIVDWGDVKRFFFEAGLRTYASGAEAITISEFPGCKRFVHEKPELGLRYVDIYASSPDKTSERRPTTGCTWIFRGDRPIWAMHYGGWWNSRNKEVIPFLKRSLERAYRTGVFYGGRGFAKDSATDIPLVYHNRMRANDFVDWFAGEEDVISMVAGTGTTEFWHWYRGGAIV